MSKGFSQTVEPQLLRRAQQGDRAAHAELYRRFGPAVFTLARRLLRRPDVAEEVLQDAFIDVLRRIGSYRGEAPLGAWIRRIAMNRCLMFLRSYWEKHSDDLPDALPATGSRPELEVENLDLLRLLEELPDTARAVVWLHDVEGYTHEEIGRLMNRSTSFSKSQLARAYNRLQASALEQEVQPCTQQPAN